ncbi:MAG: hypothetical protein ACK4TI_01350 [Nitrososphaerales archaeon]
MSCYVCGSVAYTSGGICWVCIASDTLALNIDRLGLAAVGT